MPRFESLFDRWREDADSSREAWLRAQYSPFRSYFEMRADEYVREQRWLDRAAFDVAVADYLAESVHLALAAAGIGTVAGAMLALLLAVLGVLEIGLSLVGWSLLLALFGVVLGSAGMGAGRYYYPRLVAYQRGRRIDAMFPHAILFLYALVHGGVLPQEVVRQLADAEEVYGDVSVEFDRFVTDVTWLGVDVYEAIDRAATRSPSEQLTAFFEEWGNILEMGGDVRSFLAEEVDSQLERAEEAQEQFLEQVETASEAYVVLVFAGPIFLFIVLIIISFFSPVAMFLLALLVYGFVPLGIAFFLWFFGHLIGPLQFSLGQVRFGAQDQPRTSIHGSLGETEPETTSETTLASVRETARATARNVRERNLARLQQQPHHLFFVSAPLAILVTAVLVAGGVVPLGWTPLFEQPVVAGSGLVALPFVVATLPVAAFHEWNRRRMRRVRRRFPAALRVMADANRNGVPLADSFAAVTEQLGGPLGDELAETHRDIQWFHDVETALEAFADRLSVPVISRLVYLLVESIKSTNDIAGVVDVVADDIEARNRLLQHRRQRMQSYVFIVFMGFLVFLVIVTLFDVAFLPALARFTTERKSVLQRVPIRLGALDIVAYRRLFFHTALVQAVGNGLLLGRLEANSLTSGLKYANLFLLLAVALFFAL